MKNSHIDSCGICLHKHFEELWSLPKFPFTEKYGKYAPEKCLPVDQQLLMCSACGHVQLGVQVDPQELYKPNEYSFRTSQSKTAQAGTHHFFEFFQKVAGSKSFLSCLDIGGNDLYLAKMVEGKAQFRMVIDPVCSDQDGQTVDGIKILGRFIESVDLSKDIITPDLVFCRHVLEHVARPHELFLQLFSQCKEDTLYVFEIPCFENLMEASRFDAIFHQHYHYFDLESFKRLIDATGGQYIAHEYNRQGSCGGAMLIAFKKANLKTIIKTCDIQRRSSLVVGAISDYCHFMDISSKQLKKFEKNIYGYGASLMLATLAYHLKTDFSELICILDDDEKKDGIGYQNLPVKVNYTGNYKLDTQSNFMITSLENTRSIFKRISEFTPRRVIVPFIA